VPTAEEIFEEFTNRKYVVEEHNKKEAEKKKEAKLGEAGKVNHRKVYRKEDGENRGLEDSMKNIEAYVPGFWSNG